MAVGRDIFSRKFAIDSPLPPEEAWKRLVPLVKAAAQPCPKCGAPVGKAAHFCAICGQPAPPPRSDHPPFEFEGQVTAGEFRISRLISYRNACLPVVRGKFEPSGTGTRIAVEMRMGAPGYILLIGGMLLSFLVLSVVIWAGDKPVAGPVQYLPLAVPAGVCALCWFFYFIEANLASGAMRRVWAG